MITPHNLHEVYSYCVATLVYSILCVVALFGCEAQFWIWQLKDTIIYKRFNKFARWGYSLAAVLLLISLFGITILVVHWKAHEL